MTKYKNPNLGGSLAIPQEELALIIQAIMKRRPKTKSKYFHFCNIRDSMMALFEWYIGLRCRNHTEIEMNEINLETRQIYIPPAKSKTGQQDIVIIPRCLVFGLKKYFTIRSKLFPKSKWVFPAIGRKDKDIHFNRNSFMRMFRNALKDAGLYHVKFIDKQGHARASKSSHGLRKGGATKIYMVTEDVEKVAIWLTHTDPRRRATYRYIQACKEQVRHHICDQVFDEVWRDPAKIQTQTEMLIKLLKLSQNRRVPIVKF